MPYRDPGSPPLTSAAAYLWWVARGQIWLALSAAAWGTLAFVSAAVMPYLLGPVVDNGLDDGLSRSLWTGCLLLLGAGSLGVLANVVEHRRSVESWIRAAFRSSQLLGHHVTRTGDAVTAELPTGEVVSTVASDSLRVGEVFWIVPRFVGAVVAYVVVAGLLLAWSVTLGVAVLVGLPAVAAVLALVVRPLARRQDAQRAESGHLTTLGADTVSGLRILRGIGGEEAFAERYRTQSQVVRAAGVRVAGTQSVLDALKVLLPGLFLAGVVWFGAHLAMSGEITAGQLVTFYGYAAFLTGPLDVATEAVQILTRGVVGVRRMLRVLAVPVTGADTRERPLRRAPLAPAAGRPAADDRTRGFTGALAEGLARGVGNDLASDLTNDLTDNLTDNLTEDLAGDLTDEASGLVVPAGRVTALVSADPDDSAALALRLGLLGPHAPDRAAGVRLGGVRLVDLGLGEVRRRVVVAESTPHLFTGTLRSELDVRGTTDDGALLDALLAADAGDVLESVPDGLDGEVAEKGRSLSGGQRQRLALARALLTDPEVLILVEPTSAVDAHTEARIAGRLGAARAGRTTVVVTASPLVLDAVDDVVLVADGRVVAHGTHRALLAGPPDVARRYRAVVSRAAADDEAAHEAAHDEAAHDTAAHHEAADDASALTATTGPATTGPTTTGPTTTGPTTTRSGTTREEEPREAARR
ncbi:MAG TPA: ABC transporter ATP-binding protein [Actinotalea sp.]|nr:ABC transporter ATP-binding protein [Actinotalea sp.]